MHLNEQQFEMVELGGETDLLKEHPRNPKRGNTDAIGQSMDVNGFFGAVLAQKSTGYILAGNHTFREASRKKLREIPTLWIDVDDEAALRILLADNKTAELGGYDQEALDALLAELPDLEGTGWDLAEELDQAPPPVPGPPGADDVPEDSYEAQFGVIVMCEDAEHQEAVYDLMQKLKQGIHAMDDEALTRIELRVVAI